MNSFPNPASPIPKAVWRELEKKGWPRHCRELRRPGNSSAIYFAIDHDLPELVWRPLIEAGVGLEEGILRKGCHRTVTPIERAAQTGEPGIVRALIDKGVAYRRVDGGESFCRGVWFNHPDKREDYVTLVVFLLEAGERASDPASLNPPHREAMEEAMARVEQRRLERQLPKSNTIPGRGRL